MAHAAENAVYATEGWLRRGKAFPRVGFDGFGLLLRAR